MQNGHEALTISNLRSLVAAPAQQRQAKQQQ
jgi:hypothetical protein